MTTSAPPRPPSERATPHSNPPDRDEIEALVEALIEEARQETRRRHRRYWATALVAFVGIVVLILLEGGAASQTASPAVSARMNAAAQAGTSRIAFIREPLNSGYGGVLWVMNPDGSGQRRLSPGIARGGPWSPDGQKMAFIAGGIYVINADGSGQRVLTSDPAPGLESNPAWSPDGRQIAFTRFSDVVSDIYVMNADGSEQRKLTRNPTDFQTTELAWSPRGNKIAFVSRRDGNLEIHVMNADGSEQRRLTRNTVGDRNPVWSPDGRRIAFESDWQVWVMNADGSRQERLTRNGGRNFAPSWSPGGQRIAFEHRLGRVQSTSWCSGCGTAKIFEVWVMNADGSGQQRLTRKGTRNLAPGWSPDGGRIAFVSKRDGNDEIYVMNADGSGQQNLTRNPAPDRSPVWSPGQKK